MVLPGGIQPEGWKEEAVVVVVVESHKLACQ